MTTIPAYLVAGQVYYYQELGASGRAKIISVREGPAPGFTVRFEALEDIVDPRGKLRTIPIGCCWQVWGGPDITRWTATPVA